MPNRRARAKRTRKKSVRRVPSVGPASKPGNSIFFDLPVAERTESSSVGEAAGRATDPAPLEQVVPKRQQQLVADQSGTFSLTDVSASSREPCSARVMSFDVEPGTSTMSSTHSDDWSSRWTSDNQIRTNTMTSTMTSSASAVLSGLPSGITPSGMTPPGITPSGVTPPGISPRALQNAMFSGTALKSQPRPIVDTPKNSDLKALSEPHPSTKTLQSPMRFSVVRSVRLRTTTASTETEAASVTNEDGDRPYTSETGGRARNEEYSCGTVALNVTAQWEEEEEAVENREARAELAFARDNSIRQINARAFISAEML